MPQLVSHLNKSEDKIWRDTLGPFVMSQTDRLQRGIGFAVTAPRGDFTKLYHGQDCIALQYKVNFHRRGPFVTS